MSASNANPWVEKNNVFSNGRSLLMSSIQRPDSSVTAATMASSSSGSSSSGSNNSKLAWQMTEEVKDKKESLISQLRSIDSMAERRRLNSLNLKINAISNEVKDVLAPSVIKDMDIAIDFMSGKFKYFSDTNVSNNIMKDFEGKKDFLSIDVDTKNQYKLNQLLCFANDLYSFELKLEEEAKEKLEKEKELRRIEKRKKLSPSRRNQIIEKESDTEKENIVKNETDTGPSDSRDMARSAVHALETCDKMIEVGVLLEEQFLKLKDFHEEFKTHILKFV